MNTYEERVEFYNVHGEKLVGIFHHAHNDKTWREKHMTNKLENKMAVIVEDNEGLAFVFPMFLEKLNKFDPIVLCNRYEDIGQYHLKGSLYLLDHDIKGSTFNGTEFLNIYHLPKEKVILMSGRGDSWSKYIDKGYKFIMKPFSDKDLQNIVQEMNL